MGNMNSYVNDVERNIREASDKARSAKYRADDGYRSSYLSNLESEALSTRRYASEAYYYANKASNDLYLIIREYNKEVSNLVDEINDLIDELNLANQIIANNKTEYEKKQLIAEIREIDIKAGTQWYKEVGSKKAAPLRNKLNNLKEQKADKESHINMKEENTYALNSVDSDLNRAKRYAYDAEKYANSASFDRELNDGQDNCRRAYDEAYYAEKYADDALTSLKRGVSKLERNLDELQSKKSEIKNKLRSARIEQNNIEIKTQYVDCKIDLISVQRELENKKAKLSKIYSEAGTQWYAKTGSKQAAALRTEIAQIEKQIRK